MPLLDQPGEDHLPWLGDAGGVLVAIKEFVTGSRHHIDSERILATVLFTDIRQLHPVNGSGRGPALA